MQIMLNADDFGMTHEANLGIEKALSEGYASQTSIVANTNYFDEAVDIADRHGFKNQVGLHVNLFEGAPLSSSMKKLRHYAHYDMFRYEPDWTRRLFARETDVIGEELEAQITRYLSGGFSLMNIDSHHCAFYDMSVLKALLPLLGKYGFSTMRYIGNSFFDGSFSHERFGRRWRRIADEAGLGHADYSSSVRTYYKNLRIGNPSLTRVNVAEVYVHPVIAGGYLIDNYTGGTHLRESFEETGLDKMEFVTARALKR